MSCTFLISAAALILSIAMSPDSQPVQSQPQKQQNATPEPPPDMIQANAVVQGFVRALRDSDWTRAIGYCSSKVQNAAKAYPSPEAFFRDVVPIKQVVTKTKNPIYVPSGNPSKGGPWALYALAYRVAELEPDPADKWSLPISREAWWQGGVKKADSRWVVDLPTTPPLQSYIDTSLNELKRVWEKAIVNETELEPKLKGVHTRLTPLAKRFQAGGPMPFRLELINDGPAKLVYECGGLGIGGMIVKTSQGNLVPYTAGPVQTAMHYEIIDPVQTVILLDKWDLAKQYRLTDPGHYTVQFRGGVGIAEADLHKTIQVHRSGSRTPETVPDEGRRSLRRFPSNIVEIEVVATRAATAPTK